MSYTVVADGLAEAGAYFDQAPDIAAAAARMAINDVAKGSGMKLLRTAITAQVDFPAGYVNNDRLFVSQPATNSKLEARITARSRPTSLARFAVEQSPSLRKGGVHIQVKPGGGSKLLKGAFLVRLKAGASLTEDNYNLGLAIRLKPGERIFNKREMSSVQLGHNLYILYGPSVDQVFREVASDESEPILDLIESEFYRQFVRLSDAA